MFSDIYVTVIEFCIAADMDYSYMNQPYTVNVQLLFAENYTIYYKSE